ncbi:hypothetical protein COLO4_23489 [Corchorus olitorius]|uniref:Uncharacterized protein n=1 Tax=Corchorus olitorius TaxID=93759 RepID=A0A1R3IG78_9ROSI|nr:hypothetical protein COLO4_23489 [Corchorus olitorius]
MDEWSRLHIICQLCVVQGLVVLVVGVQLSEW